MTSKIKVDNINKVSDDSNIIKKCGTTTTIGSGASNPIVVDGSAITLGRCGGTVALASGASQTGFGRTGTVDWQTSSIKTATFTATSGEGYFCNTAGGSFEVDLPTGSAGDIVSVQDYNNTFDTHGLIVDPPAGQKINGGVAGGQIELDTEGEGVTLVYIDATVGWRSIHQSTFADVGSNAVFVAASGGNATVTNGNFKTHIFTGPGTFTVSCAGNACGSNTVDYFVVAGGGGGGRDNYPGCRVGAGGGAGGFRISNSVGCLPAPSMSPLSNPTGLPVTATGYPITVGAGGAGGEGGGCYGGVRGSNSVFTGSSTITSAGGGAGAGHSPSSDSPSALQPGGSGGGNQGGGGSGNSPPVSPPQGNNAGPGGAAPSYAGGGGGGAGGVGGAQSGSTGGAGGVGSFIACAMIGPTAPSYGTPGPASGRYFAGGGGSKESGAGGAGGGAAASGGANATVNTGGGGGGQRMAQAGAGGSGIVMIRYKFQ